MKKVGLSILIVASALVSNAQNVLTIGNENISLDEFKSIFYKNNQSTEISKEYLDEYMNLFVNFKLKVIEAEELGLDTILSFVNELDGYRKQLAKPYLKNKEFDENMLIEAYNRMRQDVKASHILISVDEKASAKEKKLAYDKILAIRSDILANKISFEEAASKNSDGNIPGSTNGNLNYFTAFMMVYDFESAAYSIDIGEISMPIKTKYGYHIIKVTDKREAVGSVKVAHIVFKAGRGANEVRVNDAEDKINEVFQLLQNGEEFADVAERFSEDRSTAVKGGSLPAFGVGKMVPEFEKVAFSLKNVGDISIPFRTEYGWHIITLLERKEILEFSEIEAELKRKIEQDSRGELSQKALYEKLHNSYKVVNKPTVYSKFRKSAANKVSEGKFVKSEVSKSTLLSIDGIKLSVDVFAKYVLENQTSGSDIDDMYTDFVNHQLLAYEENKLEYKYPEYKALLKEYREGILLFDLTNKKVWTKAVEDTIGLQEFFAANQSNYVWDNRVDATVYSCIDLETAKRVKREIYKKHRGTITDSEILAKINKDAALSLQIESKKFTNGDSKHIDAVVKKAGIAKDIVLEDGSYVLVDIHEVLASGNKKLDETRGKVISDYQNTLEAEWIVSLTIKYPVVIDNEVLYSLIK